MMKMEDPDVMKTPEVRFSTYDLNVSGLAGQLRAAKALERRYVFHRYLRWPTEVPVLELARTLGEFLFLNVMSSGAEALVDVEGGETLAQVEVRHGFVHVSLSASSPGGIEDALDELASLFPRSEQTDDHLLPITFWALSPSGPQSIRRKIEVPDFREIAGNYSATSGVRAQLEELMEFRPSRGGQLILWQGPVGTGKTWSLRALGWEWREWCSIHYITDPEILFGREPAYLMQVLLGDDDDDAPPTHPTELGQPERAGRWKLLVLEDTGEMLAPDAKEHVGQGLSRLLNTVDGLIGQGLRVLVLITTNEELDRLHPAVQRPGRCVSRIEFSEFDEAEASDWLVRNGGEGIRRPRERVAVAELYALLEGRAAERDSQPVGFGR